MSDKVLTDLKEKTVDKLIEMVNERDREIAKLKAAAQSAPAGEREAFRAAHRELDLSEKPDAWGRPQFLHSHVEVTWRGFMAGAAWQRTQAAGVPDDLRIAMQQSDHYAARVETLELGLLRIADDFQPSTDAEAPLALSEMREAIRGLALAAAPAQPAVQETLYITHRPLIRNAINLLRLRRPVPPDVERVAADLEAMLDGLPTPAGEPSAAWLEVAAVAVPAQPEVQRLREALRQASAWMRSVSAHYGASNTLSDSIDAALAASTGQEV